MGNSVSYEIDSCGLVVGISVGVSVSVVEPRLVVRVDMHVIAVVVDVEGGHGGGRVMVMGDDEEGADLGVRHRQRTVFARIDGSDAVVTVSAVPGSPVDDVAPLMPNSSAELEMMLLFVVFPCNSIFLHYFCLRSSVRNNAATLYILHILQFYSFDMKISSLSSSDHTLSELQMWLPSAEIVSFGAVIHPVQPIGLSLFCRNNCSSSSSPSMPTLVSVCPKCNRQSAGQGPFTLSSIRHSVQSALYTTGRRVMSDPTMLPSPQPKFALRVRFLPFVCPQ